MLQTFALTGDRQIRMEAVFVRYDNEAHVPLRLRAGLQDLGQLWPGESIELDGPEDLWDVKGPSDAVAASGTLRMGQGRIVSARRAQALRVPVLLLESGVSAVTAGGSVPGWVSGDIASLAASATATVVFDLGPDWQQYGLVEVGVFLQAPSSGINPLQFFGSDTTAANSMRRRGAAFAAVATTFFINMTTGTGMQCYVMRPAGRYFIATAANADATNAQGPGARMTLTATPS